MPSPANWNSSAIHVIGSNPLWHEPTQSSDVYTSDTTLQVHMEWLKKIWTCSKHQEYIVQSLSPVHHQDVEKDEGTASQTVEYSNESVQVEIDSLQVRYESCTHTHTHTHTHTNIMLIVSILG